MKEESQNSLIFGLSDGTVSDIPSYKQFSQPPLH